MATDMKTMADTTCCLSKLLRLSARRKSDENLSHKNGRVEGHLVGGPSMCGKTSLLFEYAFNCAENGDYVLLIAPKPFTKLPLFINGRCQPNPMVLERINIVYLANYMELTAYFANAHLGKIRDSSLGKTQHVLIDNFDWYFQEKSSRADNITRLAKCLTYIVDAIEFWSIDSKNMQSRLETNCSVLLSETIVGESMSVEKIGLYKRWITDFIRIQKLGNSLFRIQPAGDGKNWRNGPSSDLTHCYEIDNNTIKVRQNRVNNWYFSSDPSADPFGLVRY